MNFIGFKLIFLYDVFFCFSPDSSFYFTADLIILRVSRCFTDCIRDYCPRDVFSVDIICSLDGFYFSLVIKPRYEIIVK